MMEEKSFQDALTEKKSQTIEVKRSKADGIREDKLRLKEKLRRYEVRLCLFSNSKWTRPGRTTNPRC